MKVMGLDFDIGSHESENETLTEILNSVTPEVVCDLIFGEHEV